MKINTKKEVIQSRNDCIRKSNEISMAELNQGLNLNQMQLLAFAIYSTQQDGRTVFQKHEFEKKFGLKRYRTNEAYEDSKAVKRLEIEVKDLENDYFEFTSVFTKMVYKNGRFMFEWHRDMIPHILELKEKYIITDLSIASHFKSSFSWRLYEYLKAHFGYFRKILTKNELMCLFNVENRKTYIAHTGRFKNSVLDVAIKEINQYTELDVWYKEQKKGRSIVGFEIYWSTGKMINQATQKQIDFIQSVITGIKDNLFTYVNLDNQKKRQQAYEIVKKIEHQEIHILEPTNITADKADKIIQDLQFNIELLNKIVGSDQPERDTSIYFDWINEQEES